MEPVDDEEATETKCELDEDDVALIDLFQVLEWVAAVEASDE